MSKEENKIGTISHIAKDPNRNGVLDNVVGSDFSEKQKVSLLYTVRHIIYHTRTYSKVLLDEEILKMIKEDFFGE